MPVFLGALLGGLVSIAGSFIGRVLLALGVGFVSFTGIDTSLSALRDMAIANLGALPNGVVGMLGVMKIGTGLNILFSAFSIRMVLGGLTSGTVKRMVLK